MFSLFAVRRRDDPESVELTPPRSPKCRVALSTAKDNSIRMWDLVQGKPAPRKRLDDFKTLSCACWSPDGERYAVVADDRVVLVFDANSEDEAPTGLFTHPRRVNALKFVDDVVLVSASDDGWVRLLGADGSELRRLDCRRPNAPVRVRDVSLLMEDGEAAYVAAAASDGAVRVFDLHDDTEPARAVATLRAGSGAHITCMVTVSTQVGLDADGEGGDGDADEGSEEEEEEAAAAPPPPPPPPPPQQQRAPKKKRRT